MCSLVTLGTTLGAAVVPIGHTAPHLYKTAGEALVFSSSTLVHIKGSGGDILVGLGLVGKGLLESRCQEGVSCYSSQLLLSVLVPPGQAAQDQKGHNHPHQQGEAQAHSEEDQASYITHSNLSTREVFPLTSPSDRNSTAVIPQRHLCLQTVHNGETASAGMGHILL